MNIAYKRLGGIVLPYSRAVSITLSTCFALCALNGCCNQFHFISFFSLALSAYTTLERMFLSTCAPLTVPKDLNVLIKKGLSKLCPPPGDRATRIRGTAILPSPEGIRHTRPLSLDWPLYALGAPHAHPRRLVVPTGLPSGAHATRSPVARAPLSGSFCIGCYGYPSGSTYNRGGGHSPQEPLLPKTSIGQKGERTLMGYHMSLIRTNGELCPEVYGLGGMRLTLRSNRHPHSQRRHPSLRVRGPTGRHGQRPPCPSSLRATHIIYIKRGLPTPTHTLPPSRTWGTVSPSVRYKKEPCKPNYVQYFATPSTTNTRCSTLGGLSSRLKE